LDEKTNVTSDLNEAKILLETKTGFISTFWCGNRNCEEKIKVETSADIRLIPFEGQDKIDGKLCICCGSSAKSHVILGRAY
jgi:prolyl-tRNA synthetase